MWVSHSFVDWPILAIYGSFDILIFQPQMSITLVFLSYSFLWLSLNSSEIDAQKKSSPL
jgi:hypothetical protein